MSRSDPRAKASVVVGVGDPDLRQIIGAYLVERGWGVVAMTVSHELIARTVVGRFSAAVLEVRSFASPGLSILERLRAQEPTFPVIVITSFADRYITARAERAGASRVLERPFDPATLDVALSELLSPLPRD